MAYDDKYWDNKSLQEVIDSLGIMIPTEGIMLWNNKNKKRTKKRKKKKKR